MSERYPQFPSTTFPNQVQTFTTFLDITVSDAQLIQQYQTAIQSNDYETAQNIFAQIPNGNQKIINAQKLNTIINTCEALENFYKTDVQPYVEGKQVEWQNIINLFGYKGTYNPTITYSKNNFVTYIYNGVNYVYIAVTNPPLGTVPTNTTYWRVLSIRGEKGDSGEGLSFLGEWDSTVHYTTQNVVTYGNYVWACIEANNNQAPFEGSQYWVNIGSIRPREIPIQEGTPSQQETGDLWFRIVN